MPARVSYRLAARFLVSAGHLTHYGCPFAPLQVSEAEAKQKLREKDDARQSKKGKGSKDGRVDARDVLMQKASRSAITVDLNKNLHLTVAETKDMLDDTLAYLSHGIVMAHATADKGMLTQFQKVVLSRPDRILDKKVPPLHILVVDYSSIYGMDCPAVDTLILCDDLGDALSWDDMQQFLGRLRRDGTAIFTSRTNLARAVFGAERLEEWTADLAQSLEAAQDLEARIAVLLESRFHALGAKSGPLVTSVLATTLQALGTTHREAADLARAALAVFKQLRAPLVGLLLSEADERALLDTLAAFFDQFPQARVHATKLTKTLYDLGMCSESAVLTWAKGLPEGDLKSKLAPFVEWLEQDSEEESGDDDDDEDEEEEEEEEDGDQ